MVRFASEKQVCGPAWERQFWKGVNAERASKEIPPTVRASDMEKSQGTDCV